MPVAKAACFKFEREDVMRKLLAIVMVFITVLSVSCGTDNKKKEEKPHLSDYTQSALKYLPLSVGNTWKYRVNYFGSVGENEITIVGTDGDWFLDNKGGRLKVDRHGIRDEERYILLFPLQREAWISIIQSKTKETRKTVGVDETVTVPAGTFEGAIKVHTYVELPGNKILHSFHYFVLNVGIVKIETMLQDTKTEEVTQQTKTELVSYAVQ